jgi:hypothetical protein
VADDLAAAAAVVVDASVGGLQGEAAGSRPCDDGVEAPAVVVDFDDVACLYALEPHAREVQQNPAGRVSSLPDAGATGPLRRGGALGAMAD